MALDIQSTETISVLEPSNIQTTIIRVNGIFLDFDEHTAYGKVQYGVMDNGVFVPKKTEVWKVSNPTYETFVAQPAGTGTLAECILTATASFISMVANDPPTKQALLDSGELIIATNDVFIVFQSIRGD